MFELRLRAWSWVWNIDVHRSKGGEMVDWQKRSEDMREARAGRRRELQQLGRGRQLIEFELPACFHAITNRLTEELEKCGQEVTATFNHETLEATVHKDAYPRASLKLKLRPPPPMNPEATDAKIECKSEGLGVDNRRTSVDTEYRVSVVGETLRYAKLTNRGATETDMDLGDLVDDILGPFAGFIA